MYSRRAAVSRRDRRRSPSVVLVCTVLAMIVVAAPAPTVAAPQPNVVLILSDDQAPGLMATMSYTNGRDDWLRFTNAFVNNPLCCPSRATILSGQYSHHTGVEENTDAWKFDATNTLATWLQAAGYRTGLIGKYLNGYPGGRAPYKPPGWDSWTAFLGEPQYYDYSLFNTVKRSYGDSTSDYSTDVLAKMAVAFIRSSSRRPFFLYFTPKTPHGPFSVPTPRHANDPKCVDAGTKTWDRPNFNETDVSDKPRWIRIRPVIDAGTQRTHRRHQCEMLQSLDDAVRALFNALEDSGKLNNTVVIYMTDNGYSNGSHRYEAKRCEYEECIRTPLLFRGPGVVPRVARQLVSNVDIASTIAALAGATPKKKQDGYSLVPILRDKPPARWPEDHDGLLIHYCCFGNRADSSPVPGYWGIRTAKYKYVELSTGEKELYDLVADPYELQNRAGERAMSAVQSSLASKLAALKAR